MSEDLLTLLKTGEDSIAGLEQETFICLRNLETFSEEEVEHFLRRRQQCAEEFETVVSKLRMMEKGDRQDALLLDNFQHSCRDALEGIIKADALIRALAEMRRMAIRSELDTILQGHTAMQGYHQGRGRGEKRSMRRIA